MKKQDTTPFAADLNRCSFAMKTSENWYVFYTSPRAEKVVAKELEMRGYNVFLPIVKELRVWKNRQKKMIEKVLFPSYIFVKIQESSLYEICQVPKIAAYIHCGGKPSIISLKCLDRIKTILKSEVEVSVEYDLSRGDQVRVVKGAFAGFEGVLVKQNSKLRFGLQISGVNQTILIDISSEMVEKLL